MQSTQLNWYSFMYISYTFRLISRAVSRTACQISYRGTSRKMWRVWKQWRTVSLASETYGHTENCHISLNIEFSCMFIQCDTKDTAPKEWHTKNIIFLRYRKKVDLGINNIYRHKNNFTGIYKRNFFFWQFSSLFRPSDLLVWRCLVMSSSSGVKKFANQ